MKYNPGDMLVAHNGEVRVVARPEDFGLTREEVLRRASAQTGAFKHLPGNPPPHKVLAEIDGHKVRVEEIEMIYNDTELMEAVYGLGCHDKIDHPDSPMAKARALARKLYAESEKQ